MRIRKVLITSFIGLSLSLGACDKGDAKTKDAKKTAAKAKTGDAKTKAGDTKVEAPDDKAPDDKAPDEAEDKLDDRVVKAAGLAAKIEADPAKADDILAEAGMDRAAFDALMHEVSTPELAEQYRLARAQAPGSARVERSTPTARPPTWSPSVAPCRGPSTRDVYMTYTQPPIQTCGFGDPEHQNRTDRSGLLAGLG